MNNSSTSLWLSENVSADKSAGAFFNTPDGKYAIQFYEIKEYGMTKFCSPVKIWEIASERKLLLDSGNVFFEFRFDRTISYMPFAGILCLFYPRVSNSRIDIRNVLIDLKKSSFSVFDAFEYDLVEMPQRRLSLRFAPRHIYLEEQAKHFAARDGEIMELDKLSWFQLKQLVQLH
jgi:hypothetical protein